MHPREETVPKLQLCARQVQEQNYRVFKAFQHVELESGGQERGVHQHSPRSRHQDTASWPSPAALLAGTPDHRLGSPATESALATPLQRAASVLLLKPPVWPKGKMESGGVS